MSRKKIKNPLIKRIPKEIIGDWKKYLVVFLFLVLTIGFVSGMYVANDSMLTSADEGVSKYKQEDGHFELKDKADSELVTAIESGEVKTAPDEKDSDSSKTPVMLYENFYRNETEDYDADGKKDGTIRVYTKTEDINLACLIEGSFPQNENEIAVDRMHADNVGMKVGDTIKVSGKEFKVSGLIAYVNYSTLHEKKTDVLLIVGMNKVVKTEADAMSRARNEAAPINAQRFGIDTPCSKNGTCFDCKSPQCICCQILTTRFSRVKGRFQIILVDENLGF